jgi:membrane-associated protein
MFDQLKEFFEQFFSTVYNVPELIRLVGFYGLIAIVFAETGLLIGFFLPGDSLLIIAGVFAGQGHYNIVTLNIVLIIAAIAGDATGYAIGKRTGKALYSRPDSFLFRKEHLRLTQEFYDRHGGKTIIFARFMPIVRTFAPVVAGVAEMGYARFAAYNVIGGIAWVTSCTVGGYLLGEYIESRIHLVVGVIIVVSLLPPGIAWLRSRMVARKATP